MNNIDSYNFFDAISELYLVLNPDLTIHAVTDGYLKLKIKSRNEIIGHDIFDQFLNITNNSINQREKLQESLKLVLNKKVTNTVEIKETINLKNHSFKEIYWRIENSPLFNKNGEVNYIIQKMEDITDLILQQKETKTDSLVESMKLRVEEMSRELAGLEEQLNKEILETKITNQSLRKNKEQMKLITDAMPVLISYIDSKEIFRFNNKNYLEWFAMTPEQIYGKPLKEVAGEQFYKIAKGYFQKALSGEKVTYEALGNFPIGTRFVRVSYIPDIFDNKVVGCFTMVEDISKEKETEEQLRRQNEELQNFAYIASHDLQEPLRMISGYSQLLARRYKDNLDEQANEFINFILDGSKRMKTLIEDILSHSRIVKKENNLVLTDLNIVINSVESNLKLSIEESDAKFIYNQLPTVRAERTHMLQLFQNLISNSIKYQHKDISPIITINAQKSDNNWLFSIKDNGIGINKTHFENIFIIFKRLHSRSEYEGTGIGLANCKKIIEIYGGKIWVESEEGKGSTFFFTLPV